MSALRVPTGAAPQFRAYKISKQFDQDISAVMGAFNITISGRKITSARLAFGGMAATPKRATNAESCLVGAAVSMDCFTAAAAALEDDFSPIDDMRASAEYRIQVAQNLLVKYGLDMTGSPVPRLVGVQGNADIASLLEAG